MLPVYAFEIEKKQFIKIQQVNATNVIHEKSFETTTKLIRIGIESSHVI